MFKIHLFRAYDSFGNRSEDLKWLDCWRHQNEGYLIVTLFNFVPSLLGLSVTRPSNNELIYRWHKTRTELYLSILLSVFFTFSLLCARALEWVFRSLQIEHFAKPFRYWLWSCNFGRERIYRELDAKHVYRNNNPAIYTLKPLRGLSPYICLHLRDHRFNNDPQCESRNTSINEILPLLDFAYEIGFAVIRIGNYFDRCEHPALIDYGRSRARSEANDLRVISGSEIYVGSVSGPIDFAVSIGKRIVALNPINLAHCHWLSERCAFIPKPLVDAKTGERIGLHRALQISFSQWGGDGEDLDSKYLWGKSQVPELIVDAVKFSLGIQSADRFGENINELILKEYSQTDSTICSVDKKRWLARLEVAKGRVFNV